MRIPFFNQPKPQQMWETDPTKYNKIIESAYKSLLNIYNQGINNINHNRKNKKIIIDLVNKCLNVDYVKLEHQQKLRSNSLKMVQNLDHTYESEIRTYREIISEFLREFPAEIVLEIDSINELSEIDHFIKESVEHFQSIALFPELYSELNKINIRIDEITKLKKKHQAYLESEQYMQSLDLRQTQGKPIESKPVVTVNGVVEKKENRAKSNNSEIFSAVTDFLDYILVHHQLSIKDYFNYVNTYESFFLVAATGLGKTVAMPVALLLKSMQTGLDTPKVWVVVPKIPIAINEAIHLNEIYDEFKNTNRLLVIPTELKELFGYRTSTGSKYTNAPIQFITTGVLPLITNSGELNKKTDIIVIDEAHVTLEADEAIELALESLWKQGIVVNYMSATVETANLVQKLNTKLILADKSRFTNFYHNTGQPLLDCIEEVIQNTLGEFNIGSKFYPKKYLWENNYDQLITGVNPQNRSSGMLIVVSSFASNKTSDRAKLELKIKNICSRYNIQILSYAGEVERNKQRKTEFQAKLEQINKKNQKYIIIATNIIEMGVTFPTLDYVVTMDSEMSDVMISGFKFPQTVPLGTNALKQRGGRVGRKRPGIVYITKEYGTNYTDLDDYELNFGGLSPQPIRFPLEYCEPYKLAFSLCVSGIYTQREVLDYLKYSNLPSLYKNQNLMYLAIMTKDLIDKYKSLGVDDPKNALALSISQRWVGDNIFPFVFEAFKHLVDNGYKGIKLFTVMIYYGVLLDFPVKDILLEGTVDHYDGGGRALVRDLPLKDVEDDSTISIRYTNNSDLIRLAVEMAYGEQSRFTLGLLEQYKPGGNAWSPEGVDEIRRAGLNHVGFNKLKVYKIKTFLEISKQMKKLDFEKSMEEIGRELPQMDKFIEKGRYIDKAGWLSDEDFDLDGYVDYVAFFKRIDGQNNQIYYNQALEAHETVYNMLLRIYQCIGFQFTVEPTDKPGEYIYSGIKDGKAVQGLINQKDHYCQLNPISTFYGVLKPQIDKNTGQTIFNLIHILRIGKDYHGN